MTPADLEALTLHRKLTEKFDELALLRWELAELRLYVWQRMGSCDYCNRCATQKYLDHVHGARIDACDDHALDDSEDLPDAEVLREINRIRFRR